MIILATTANNCEYCHCQSLNYHAERWTKYQCAV